MTDDGYFFAACDGFFGEEVAADGGLGAKDVEEVRLGDDSADEMRMVIVVEADSDGTLLEEGHVGEGGGLSAPDVFVPGVCSGEGE